MIASRRAWSTLIATYHGEALDKIVIPVMQETLDVQKRRVLKGGYRIKKTVDQREEVVDEPLSREEVSIERVALNQIVSNASPPQVRYEGDTMIVPVLEEVFVVEKRLLLKEEIRVRRTVHEVHAPQRVVVRSEKVVLEQINENGEVTALPRSLDRLDHPDGSS